MKFIISSLFIFSILTLGYTPLFAQVLTNPLFSKSIIHKKASMGLGYGFGFATLQMNEINQRLEQLQIGQITDLQGYFPLYFYIEGADGLGLSIDGYAAISPENDVYKRDTYLSFQTLGFGATLHIPLIYSNRVGVWATAGIRSTNMYFQYNFNTSASADFSGIFTNPASHNNSIDLISSSNQMAAFGGKFQYRFWRKDRMRPYEIRVGINSEYNYSYSQDPWREKGSRAAINDMPKINPKNLSFNLNFTFLGTLKEN